MGPNISFDFEPQYFSSFECLEESLILYSIFWFLSLSLQYLNFAPEIYILFIQAIFEKMLVTV